MRRSQKAVSGRIKNLVVEGRRVPLPCGGVICCACDGPTLVVGAAATEEGWHENEHPAVSVFFWPTSVVERREEKEMCRNEPSERVMNDGEILLCVRMIAGRNVFQHER